MIMGQTMSETQSCVLKWQAQVLKLMAEEKQMIASSAVNEYKTTFQSSHEQSEDWLNDKESQLDELLKSKEEHYEQLY